MNKKNTFSWSNSQPLRFLIVGAWNFVFGYVAFSGLYWGLNKHCADWAITSMATIFGITMSFLTHRFITYKSQGCWWMEYLRFYIVYGGQSILNVLLIWIFVTEAKRNAYIVQLSISTIMTIISYWGHKHFSFRKESAK